MPLSLHGFSLRLLVPDPQLPGQISVGVLNIVKMLSVFHSLYVYTCT